MAYTTIDKPSDYFETKLYVGNAGTNNITGLDFAPNFVWLKDRTNANSGRINDTVRTATKYLIPSTTGAEATESAGLTSFNSDGFSLGSNSDFNGNSANFVSWNWKAGTSFTNDASATGIGTIDSTGSVNTDAGFSIISYTGNGSAGATVAHGLGVAPKMIIVKRRNSSANWFVGHNSLGWTKYLYLDLTEAESANSGAWNNTAPTSSVFSLGTFGNVNASSSTYIAYCFAEKKGYSKFGSYTGNGNADGAFAYTGFKPAFVIIKRTSGADNWEMWDNKRNTFNATVNTLRPNTSEAENTSTYPIDFLSNGMKMRNTTGHTNTSGQSYIYMAFAENPFVTSTGVPATAR